MSQEWLDDVPLNPAERELQRSLGQLTPAAAGVSRDAVLFEAGRASAPRTARAWPVACVLLAGIAAWGILPPAAVVERTIVVHDTSPAPVPAREPPVNLAVPVPAIDQLFDRLPENAYLPQRSAWLANGALPALREPGARREGPGPTTPKDDSSKPIWQLRREIGDPS